MVGVQIKLKYGSLEFLVVLFFRWVIRLLYEK